MLSVQDVIVGLGSNFSINISEIFLYFQDLGILVSLQFQVVKQADNRVLFFVDIAQDIYLLDDFFLLDFKICMELWFFF